MVVGFALFVGGCILATLPYDAPAPDDPAVTVECGPPPFELVATGGDDRQVAIGQACGASASSRFWFGLLGMVVGVSAGLAGRRIHRRQVMAALAAGADARADGAGSRPTEGAPVGSTTR